MEALTGKEVRHTGVGEISDELLWSDVSSDKAVVLSSCHFIASNPYHLHTEHAYAVTGRRDYGDGDVVYELRDPWNASEPILVAYRDLAKYFNFVDVVSPGGTP
jgi:hypothetical protein